MSDHDREDVRVDAFDADRAETDALIRAGGTAAYAGITTIDSVVAVDLDGDGTAEQVALISCRPGEIPLGQVVALRRTGAGFTTLGVVTQVEKSGAASSGTPRTIQRVRAITGARPGEIRVEVGNYETTYTDLSGGPIGLWQWRVFRWDGSAFAQSAGSPSFAVDQAASPLVVNVGRLELGPQNDGRRSVTVRMTVDGLSELPAGTRVSVLLSLATGRSGSYTIWRSGCAQAGAEWALCQVTDMSPGRRLLIFSIEAPAMPAPQIMEDLGFSRVFLRVGDQEFGRYTLEV